MCFCGQIIPFNLEIVKRIACLSFIALLASCSSNSEHLIKVLYSDADGTSIFTEDLFSNMEMIHFTGEQCPILSSGVNLIVRNNIYYIADPYTERVYSFNQHGEHLNNIGSKGRGPDEYITISEMSVNDQGNRFSDRSTSLDFIISKPVAFKNQFFENKRYAILQASIDQMDNNMSRMLYGILDKDIDTWKWFYIKENDYCPTIKYLDDEYAYFAAESAQMKGSEDDGMVILKCKLNK